MPALEHGRALGHTHPQPPSPPAHDECEHEPPDPHARAGGCRDQPADAIPAARIPGGPGTSPRPKSQGPPSAGRPRHHCRTCAEAAWVVIGAIAAVAAIGCGGRPSPLPWRRLVDGRRGRRCMSPAMRGPRSRRSAWRGSRRGPPSLAPPTRASRWLTHISAHAPRKSAVAVALYTSNTVATSPRVRWATTGRRSAKETKPQNVRSWHSGFVSTRRLWSVTAPPLPSAHAKRLRMSPMLFRVRSAAPRSHPTPVRAKCRACVTPYGAKVCGGARAQAGRAPSRRASPPVVPQAPTKRPIVGPAAAVAATTGCVGMGAKGPAGTAGCNTTGGATAAPAGTGGGIGAW